MIAGWSSLVARWAHNPKVVGSNPTPATKVIEPKSLMYFHFSGIFLLVRVRIHPDRKIHILKASGRNRPPPPGCRTGLEAVDLAWLSC